MVMVIGIYVKSYASYLLDVFFICIAFATVFGIYYGHVSLDLWDYILDSSTYYKLYKYYG